MKLTYFLYWSSSFLSLMFSSFIDYIYCFILAESTGEGAPKFFFKYSIELFGLSCSSYKPTRALVK